MHTIGNLAAAPPPSAPLAPGHLPSRCRGCLPGPSPTKRPWGAGVYRMDSASGFSMEWHENRSPQLAKKSLPRNGYLCMGQVGQAQKGQYRHCWAGLGWGGGGGAKHKGHLWLCGSETNHSLCG